MAVRRVRAAHFGHGPADHLVAARLREHRLAERAERAEHDERAREHADAGELAPLAHQALQVRQAVLSCIA